MFLPIVILSSIVASIPPLTADQERLLATAYDGRGHEEPAIWALLQNTEQWDGDVGDTPIRLQPALRVMAEEPEAYRGDLCRIRGTIAQIEPLRSPYLGIEGWFIRSAEDTPALVYIDFREGRGAPTQPFQIGDRVEVDARFYKRVDAIDRRGEEQTYAAFVGAFPRRWVDSTASPDVLGVMAVLVGAMGAVFLVLFIYVRRSACKERARYARQRELFEDLNEDDEQTLPADPVEAMNVLRLRAEDQS